MTPLAETAEADPFAADVIEAMKDVVDPELGINVVDLGLVYGVNVHDGHDVTLDMTLTSAACPLTDVIEDQTAAALADLVPTTRSTGCGCRRGGRTRSPTTAASSCGHWASGSDVQRVPLQRACIVGAAIDRLSVVGFRIEHMFDTSLIDSAAVRSTGCGCVGRRRQSTSQR